MSDPAYATLRQDRIDENERLRQAFDHLVHNSRLRHDGSIKYGPIHKYHLGIDDGLTAADVLNIMRDKMGKREPP